MNILTAERPTATSAASAANARRDFYDRIASHSMTPLWEVLGALVPPHPRSPAVPQSGAMPTCAST